METRARYVLIGLLLLAVLIGGFGFVYWLENIGGIGERTTYRIRFESPVPGLLVGAAVQFNGIRVGEVTDLALNDAEPRQVMATIAVASTTPVRADTGVSLLFGGLTGVPEVALAGGEPGAPPVPAADDGPPVLVAPAIASLSWTEAARETFARTDQLLTENSAALQEVVTGIAAFSEALGRNAGKVDGILKGLERMTGGSSDGPPTILSLTPPTQFPPLGDLPAGQLVVARPGSVVALETQWILLASASGLVPSFPEARWGDSLPKLLQSAVVQSFENAGFLKIGTDMSEIEADRQLILDLRAFQVADGSTPMAEIDFTAKLADGDGAVLAAQRFQASAPAAELTPAASAAALSEAFGKAATDLVVWTFAELRK